MPLTAISCERCLEDIPLAEAREHFKLCDGAPLPLVSAVVALTEGDTRHMQLQVTTTSALSCPRKTVLQLTQPYSVRLKEQLALSIGTWGHDALANAEVDNEGVWIKEECTCHKPFPVTEQPGEDYPGRWVFSDGVYHESACHKVLCTFRGKIRVGDAEIELSGRVDAIRNNPDGTIDLYDYKFVSAKNAFYLKPDEPKDDYMVQLAVNAELARQNGYQVANVHSVVMPWNDIFIYKTPPWDLSKALGIYTGSGDYQAGELYRWTSWALEEIKAGSDPAEVVHEIPMVGLTRFRSRKGESECSWCSVAAQCRAIGGGL